MISKWDNYLKYDGTAGFERLWVCAPFPAADAGGVNAMSVKLVVEFAIKCSVEKLRQSRHVHHQQTSPAGGVPAKLPAPASSKGLCE